VQDVHAILRQHLYNVITPTDTSDAYDRDVQHSFQRNANNSAQEALLWNRHEEFEHCALEAPLCSHTQAEQRRMWRSPLRLL